MKKKLIFCALTAAALIALLADAERVQAAMMEALALCARTVIPSQFLFLALSSLLVSLGLGELLAPRLEFLMRPLFRVDGAGASALVLGLIGGYPAGARTAAELYQARLLTRAEAEQLLAFCNNANPAFLISVLGVGVFHSVRVGMWLWIIHVLSALLTGICFRNYGGRERHIPSRAGAVRAVSFSTAFVAAVKSALSTVLSICAFVSVFYTVAQPLRFLPGSFAPAAVGFLELFSVIPLLPQGRFGFCLAASLAGWGGVSVLCQTMAVLADSGLSAKTCWLGKALQAGLSALLALLAAGWVFG